jgi:hypothetical protein
MNLDKAGAILTAAIIIILGGKIIYHPRWYAWFRQREIDLTGFNVPFGIALVVMGFCILWIGVIKPRKENLICPKCEDLFRWSDTLGDKCPKCGAGLEDLRGFYERHPELRYRRKTK